MFSGLTLGLLSLDPTTLHVLSVGGKPDEQKYAKRIAPLVKRHHLLLVTLLLSNATAMEALPLFLDNLVPEVIAIVISVSAVLLFGE
jgi:metal transporter CNNM